MSISRNFRQMDVALHLCSTNFVSFFWYQITDSVVDRLRIELDKSSVHHQHSQTVPEPPKEQTQMPPDPPQPPPPKIEPVVEVPEPVVAPPEPAPGMYN